MILARVLNTMTPQEREQLAQELQHIATAKNSGSTISITAKDFQDAVTAYSKTPPTQQEIDEIARLF